MELVRPSINQRCVMHDVVDIVVAACVRISFLLARNINASCDAQKRLVYAIAYELSFDGVMELEELLQPRQCLSTLNRDASQGYAAEIGFSTELLD